MAKWSDEKVADLTRRLADTAINYKQRCEELEAKLRKSALQELSALDQASEAYQAQLAAEAKLQDQTHLIEQLFALLDKTEETDDGRVFHPNQLRSCRASDTEKLNEILAKMKGQDDEGH